MSLYGPRINIPQVDIPTPSNPSWNFDKEKKLIIVSSIFEKKFIYNVVMKTDARNKIV
jgi:hypothetical protein